MVIGVTGGIGSGKSQVAAILKEKFNFHVLQTDLISKELLASDESLKCRLKQAFGNDIFLENGTLNKEAYASLIYSDAKNQNLSDLIIHPVVWKEVERRIGEIKGNSCIETALPGNALSCYCDEIWFVKADKEIRIRRLMETRNYTKEYAEKVISSQIPDRAYEELSDRIISNNGSMDDLEKEIGRSL